MWYIKKARICSYIYMKYLKVVPNTNTYTYIYKYSIYISTWIESPIQDTVICFAGGGSTTFMCANVTPLYILFVMLTTVTVPFGSFGISHLPTEPFGIGGDLPTEPFGIGDLTPEPFGTIDIEPKCSIYYINIYICIYMLIPKASNMKYSICLTCGKYAFTSPRQQHPISCLSRILGFLGCSLSDDLHDMFGPIVDCPSNLEIFRMLFFLFKSYISIS